MNSKHPAAWEIRDLVWRLAPTFVLSIPHLDLPAGATTALLGRSASGKSTLLTLLGRVEGGYFDGGGGPEGSIHVRGLPGLATESIDILALGERELLRKRIRGPGIGFVFQREGLFPDRDAVGNVAWALERHGASAAEARLRAERTLASVGLAADRRVATLSGGERKRLALARALALEPAMLLLDEPLTGLDPEALQALRTLLGDLRRAGRTMVLVTHQAEDVLALADHVVFLDAGRVVLQGPIDALRPAVTRFFEGDIPGGATTAAEVSTT
jgi:polar amino acid transport system ATP-binding protein